MNISVQVEGRPDGGIRVTSADVSGLLMSHSNAAWLWSTVGDALKGLLEADRSCQVASVLYPPAYPQGSGPHDVGVQIITFEVRLAA